MLTVAGKRPELVKEILEEILLREGSDYTDRPFDRGGPTKHGVTIATLRAYLGDTSVGPGDVESLDRETAERIYLSVFFNGHGFEKIIHEAPYRLVLDCSINHGPRTAARILQRSCGVEDDGMIGPITVRAANRLPERSLLLGMIEQRGYFYLDLMISDPTQIVHARGWFRHRVFAFLSYAK
jgi:lysozyme family protein